MAWATAGSVGSRGLMNLLQRFTGLGKGSLRAQNKKAGVQQTRQGLDYDSVEGWKRPLWQRPTPTETRGARNPRLQPGWINRLYMNPTTGVGTAARLTGLGVGGAVGADRLAAMMRGDEVSPDATAPVGVGSYTPSPGASMPTDFESRLAFEQRKSKRMNKQMKKLLQFYGIVNLVNPDSASDMLKLGTAMLEQEISQMGTDRQAKIFDAIFKDGSMPKSGAEAARMILNAGGTAEDVADITDIYESITPKAPDLAEDERGVLDLQQARSLVAAGYDNEAINLIEDSIRAGRLENEQQAGMNLPPREQAKMMVQAMGGAASGGLDSSLLNIEPE